MPEGPLGLFINETRGGHQPAVDARPPADLRGGHVRSQRREHRPRLSRAENPDVADLRRDGAPGQDLLALPAGLVLVTGDDQRTDLAVRALAQPGTGTGQHDLRAEAAGRVGARGAGDPGAHDDQPHRTPPLRVCSLASRCTSRPWSGRAGENTHSTWVGPAVGGTWKVCGALDWKVKASPAPSVNVSPATTIRS